MYKEEFSRYFDHTLLKQDMTLIQLETLVQEGLEWGFASICIPPLYVSAARQMDSQIPIATVIDFPLGYGGLAAKLDAAEAALKEGADELDVVASAALLKNRDYEAYGQEISRIKMLMPDKTLKVIIETSLLQPEEILLASQICQERGADYVKTSTGFGARGASLEDIRLIREGAPGCLIKASGGIRTLEDALAFISAGVQRIGSSNAVSILSLFVSSQVL